MKTVIIIGGGDSFDTFKDYEDNLAASEVRYDQGKQSWKIWLKQELEGAGDYTVYIPKMPSPDNALYTHWKLQMDKVMAQIEGEIILVGHSLGGIFLAQYVSEQKHSVDSLHLVAAPYDRVGSFDIPSLEGLDVLCNKIVLYHSRDDVVVPFDQLEQYQERLPKANVYITESSGHFLEPTFGVLLEHILSLNKVDIS